MNHKKLNSITRLQQCLLWEQVRLSAPLSIATLLLMLLTVQDCLGLDAPTINVKGSFVSPQSVTISCPTCPGGTVYYYTLDGSQPSTASNLYSKAITISEPLQLNAVSYQSPTYSSVTSAYYDIDPNLALVLVPPPGGSTKTPKLWLKADLFAKTNSENPGKVNFWADLSGSDNHATGASGTMPVLVKNAINGSSAVGFNGSQFLTLPSGFPSFSGVTLFVVTQPTALTASARILDLGTGSSSNINVLMRIAGSGSKGEVGIINSKGSGTFAASLNALDLNQYQLLEGWLSSGTTGSFYVNESAGSSTAMNSIDNSTRSTNYIGQSSAGGAFYQGKISELILYNQALTDAERHSVQSFLLQKYQALLQTTPSKPVFSLPTSALSQPAQLVLRSEPGTTIRFTSDNSTPSSSSPVWNGCPYTVNFSQTIKAIAIRNGVLSTVESKTYTLDPSQYPAPQSSDTTAPTINLQVPTPAQ